MLSVVICFQISIFEPLETTIRLHPTFRGVVICFQISIFEPLETTPCFKPRRTRLLWFAFKLVSLNHWKQLVRIHPQRRSVVICFQISIFEPLETTNPRLVSHARALWFAFKLVSLNHWKQLNIVLNINIIVVICFQISIFEPLETTQKFYHT